jgi:hypothetical protein
MFGLRRKKFPVREGINTWLPRFRDCRSDGRQCAIAGGDDLHHFRDGADGTPNSFRGFSPGSRERPTIDHRPTTAVKRAAVGDCWLSAQPPFYARSGFVHLVVPS